MNARYSFLLLLTVCGLQPSLGFGEEPFLTATAPAGTDRYESALLDLEQRLRTLEEENERLRRQFDSSIVTGEDLAVPAIDDSGVPRFTESSSAVSAFQQESAKAAEAAESEKAEPPKEKKWFEKYTVRGYVQLRANDVLDDDGPAAAQVVGDSSIGDRQSFLLRRVRMIIQGDVSQHVALYFQPDFAAGVPGSPDSNQYAQIRDIYADVHLDDQKELRFRVGQSKVPYGWENLQSSSNRLPLDRNDALNSSFRNERDLGIFFYWTPVEVQEFFKYVNDEGLKGSGN